MPKVDIDADENSFVINYKDPEEVIQNALDEALDKIDKLEKKNNKLQEKVFGLKDDIRLVAAIFVPFLQKLMEMPDKDLMEWPDRNIVLQKKLDKMLALTNIE